MMLKSLISSLFIGARRIDRMEDGRVTDGFEETKKSLPKIGPWCLEKLCRYMFVKMKTCETSQMIPIVKFVKVQRGDIAVFELVWQRM